MLVSDFSFFFSFSFFFFVSRLLGFISLSLFFWVSMVSSSKVRIVCPSISFLFAHLGASLGVSHSFSPWIESFVFEGNSLSVVLADLLPLLHQSVNWFKGLVVERRAMLEVRSSKLETGLSSSDNPVELEVDIAASDPREIKVFHALGEVCNLDDETLSRFRGRFQFPDRLRVRHSYFLHIFCHYYLSCSFSRAQLRDG